MITKQEESPGYLFSLEIKGGPGSGIRGHVTAKPGGSVQGGGKGRWGAENIGNAVKGGKIDRSKYKTMSQADRVRVLQFALSKYREKYVPIAKVTSPSRKWAAANGEIGKIEGIRRAFVNRAEKLTGVEKRKVYHAAIALQDKASTLSAVRDQ